MVVQQLYDSNPDGATFGSSTTEKLSFYGVTTVVQPSSASQDVVSGSATASTTVLREQLDETIVLVNQLRKDLVEIGIIKGSV